jgi:small nuclear ribonucleoprotein (snRNP)-like protein
MVMPLEILENSLESNFVLTLKDGRTVHGKLVGFDQYMNLVLEDAMETRNDEKRTLGTIVLRGNNVVSIAQA